MPEQDRWLLLATAPDQLTAEMWQEMLRRHQIPVIISPGDTSSFMGVSTFPCRLMVRSGYLGKAKEVLAELKPES